MGIAKGQTWGERGPLPDDAVVVDDDATLRALVERARRAGEQPPPIGLLGGDLCRSLGGRGDENRLRSPDATRVVVDVVRADLDGDAHWFVAHLVARRSWWQGRIVAAMNADWLGGWNVAPRAHPGDGLVDVVDADPPLGDRWKARARLPSGSHVPHPAIGERRVRSLELAFDRPLRLWLDGERAGRARSVRLTVEPDALRVVV